MSNTSWPPANLPLTNSPGDASWNCTRGLRAKRGFAVTQAPANGDIRRRGHDDDERPIMSKFDPHLSFVHRDFGLDVHGHILGFLYDVSLVV